MLRSLAACSAGLPGQGASMLLGGSAAALWTASTAPSAARRALSVLSWGRNAEHQCGIEGPAAHVVLAPTVVLDLLQQPVTALAAGKSSSAAVLAGEAVYTWGEGSCGKLGLGSGDSTPCPARVEAFVGRSAIRAVSLGHQYSLFLDADGHLWATGENKEGQCGLGTPLSVLAVQHRQAYQEALRPALAAMMAQSRPSPERLAQQQLRAAAAAAAMAQADGGAAHVAHGWGSLGGGWGSAGQHSGGGGGGRSRSWLSGPGSGRRYADPWDAGSARARAPGASGRAAPLQQQQPGAGGSISSTGQWGPHDLRAYLQALQMQPGQTHTPVRVGCERVPAMLFEPQGGADGGGSSGSADSSSAGASAAADADAGTGLAGERVVSMAAGKFFSVAATAKGEVWTWGACYNGSLGSESSSWQASATRVSDAISEALAARGGAVAVAAGSTFAAALTASGRVVVWGKVVTNSNASGSSDGGSSCRSLQSAGAASSEQGAAAGAAAASSWCEVALPVGVRATHIAAGQQHLLVSDGRAVWAVGRWMDEAGDEAGCARCEVPAQLLALPDGCDLTRLVAGMHSSAAVDGWGRLWLWGRLLDEHHARTLTRGVAHVGGHARGGVAEGGAGGGPAAYPHYAAVDWTWAGFGGAAPRVVSGLTGVRDVALGGWHALALVD